MLPNLHLLSLLGLLICGSAGSVVAAGQASTADMVRNLGDDAFDVREMATLQLAKLGLSAKAELLAGIRGDNPEIRWRCERLWSRVRDVDFQQRAELFLADPDGLKNYEFPGWPVYRERFGSSASARQLFLNLQKGEPKLWEEFGGTPPGGRSQFNRICRQLRAALRKPGERSKISGASAISILYMATVDGVMSSKEDREWADELWQVAAVVDLVTSEKAWASLKQEWFRSGTDGRPAFERLMNDLEAGLDSAIPVASGILSDPETTVFQKQYALLALTTSKDPEDKALVASFLQDATLIDTYFSDGKVIKSQLRDVALAASILLADRDPMVFGFRNLRRDPKTVLALGTIGFVSAEERREAFDKWSEVTGESSEKGTASD